MGKFTGFENYKNYAKLDHMKENTPIEKGKDYEDLGRQLLKVNPKMADIMFERAGLPKEEREKFLAEDASRPETGHNESGSGRKFELETIRVMLKQHNFSDEEIDEILAGKSN